MKKAFLILGIAAAALAVSCNKDELNNKEVKVFEGDKAYVVVNINGVSTTQTRADSDGDFLYGTSDENSIKNVYFYFYKSDGSFVAEAAIMNPTGKNTYEDGSNIAYETNTVVTLSGLTSKEYPSWVVTVVNRPSGFSAPTTLAGFADELADASSELYQSDNTNFVMTTSSYYGTDNAYTSGSDTYYFATPVISTNFVPEEIDYDTDNNPVIPTGYTPVYVYVERLAAKVTVAISSTALTKSTTVTDAYELEQKVVGNDQTATAQTLYIKFNGWKLNATAKKSYYMKEIDATWDNTTTGSLGFVWNVPEFCRSYWAKAWTYGITASTSFPTTGSNGNTDTKEADESTALSSYLTYTSLSGTPNQLGSYGDTISYGDVEYCAENTTTSANESVPSALTSILLSATVCDNSGKGIDIVRHNGQIYTLESYFNLAIEDGLENYYSDAAHTTPIAASDLKVVAGTDGKMTVGLNVTTVYDADGTDVTTAATEALTTFNDNIGSDANYFNGGAMYYNIPVRHLNTTEPTTSNDETVYSEGYYGVVRNHWYLGIITKLTSLGKGISNTDEVIVPIPEPEAYYIGAEINILEWAYVNWNIEL